MKCVVVIVCVVPFVLGVVLVIVIIVVLHLEEEEMRRKQKNPSRVGSRTRIQVVFGRYVSLYLLRLLTCITYKTRNSDSCHFLLVSPTRNITTRMLRNTYLALRARTQLEHRYPYSSDPIRLLRIYGTSWVHIVVMIVLFLWDCIHVVISPVHFYDFLKEEDSRECVLCPVAIIF